MNKLTDSIRTLGMATYYSCRFCWNGAKLDTSLRITLALTGTLFSYALVTTTGEIINAVQRAIQSNQESVLNLTEFLSSDSIRMVYLFVGLSALSAGVSQLNWFVRSRLNQSLRYKNQQDIHDHKATLDVAMLNSKVFDDLERRINELPTGWQTRIVFSGEVLSIITMLFTLSTFGYALYTSNPWYTLTLSLAAVPMILVEFVFVNRWWNLYMEMVPVHKKRSVLERPYRNVKSFVQAIMFNQIPPLRKAITENRNGILEASQKIRRETLWANAFSNSAVILGLGVIIGHAAWNLITGRGEIGTLTVIIASARAFQGNLDSIVGTIAEQWNSAKVVLLIEEDFFKLKPKLTTENPVIPTFTHAPHIRFENVCFHYPDTDTLVLKNISFEVKPGQKVAIVGKSGNGKSSLATLLMRHYDPVSGNIFVGDLNLKNITPTTWAKYASALMQSYTIENRTVGAEIASSRLDQPIDLERVAESCRFAHFMNVVESDPLGFDSQIGTEFGGREFSGGESQRLALARVHYRGTPILILDEPDSKLDAESAQKVMEHIFALTGITVILITHHVSYAEKCDHVIVMGKGEIEEQGNPAELKMNEHGSYAKLLHKDEARRS